MIVVSSRNRPADGKVSIFDRRRRQTMVSSGRAPAADQADWGLTWYASRTEAAKVSFSDRRAQSPIARVHLSVIEVV